MMFTSMFKVICFCTYSVVAYFPQSFCVLNKNGILQVPFIPLLRTMSKSRLHNDETATVVDGNPLPRKFNTSPISLYHGTGMPRWWKRGGGGGGGGVGLSVGGPFSSQFSSYDMPTEINTNLMC